MPLQTFGQLIDRNTPAFDSALGQVQQFAHDLRSSIVQRQQAEQAFNQQLALEDFKHQGRLEMQENQFDFQREMAGVQEAQQQQQQAIQAYENAEKAVTEQLERITKQHPEIREFNLHKVLPQPTVLQNEITGLPEMGFVDHRGERIGVDQYEESLSKMQQVGTFLDDLERNYTRLNEESRAVERTLPDGRSYVATELGRKEARAMRAKFLSERTPQVMANEANNILTGAYELNINVDPEDAEPRAMGTLGEISGRLITLTGGKETPPAVNLQSTGGRIEFDGTSIQGSISNINAHIEAIAGVRPHEIEDVFEKLSDEEQNDVSTLMEISGNLQDAFNQVNRQLPNPISMQDYQFSWWTEGAEDVDQWIHRVRDTDRFTSPAAGFFKSVSGRGQQQLQ